MGLDQYAYARPAELDRGEDGENNENRSMEEAQSPPRMDGEVVQRQGGNPVTSNGFGTDFNCVELEITESDIEQLEAHV